jgi:hypothetical protein
MDTIAQPCKKQRTFLGSIASSNQFWHDMPSGDSLTRKPEPLCSGIADMLSDDDLSPFIPQDVLDIPRTNSSEFHNSMCLRLPCDIVRDSTRSDKVDWQTAANITTLCVNIHGLDTLSLTERIETILDILEQVEDAANMHGVLLVSKHLDTGAFILTSEDGADSTHDLPASCMDNSSSSSQASIVRMLTLASDLHHRLRCIPPRGGGVRAAAGVAYGAITVLRRGTGESRGACGALSIRGDAADTAERMAAAAAPGTAAVHESALWRLAAAARRPPPPAEPVAAAADGLAAGRAAVFDLDARAFRRPAAALCGDEARRRRLCKSASFA